MKDLNMNMNVNELNIILRALSTLPYNQVHELIAKLQQQARLQLEQGNGISNQAETTHTNN